MAPLCAISLDIATKKSYITVMVHWFYLPADEVDVFKRIIEKYALTSINWKAFRTQKRSGWQQVGKNDWAMVRGEYIVVFRTKQERDHVEMIYKMMKGEERLPVSLAA